MDSDGGNGDSHDDDGDDDAVIYCDRLTCTIVLSHVSNKYNLCKVVMTLQFGRDIFCSSLVSIFSYLQICTGIYSIIRL